MESFDIGHRLCNSQRHSSICPCRSISSLLLWRSILGPVATWAGSSSSGIYLLDAVEEGKDSLIRHIAGDRRMFHLPVTLRDFIVARGGLINKFPTVDTRKVNCSDFICNNYKTMELLPYPRISGSSSLAGIACMSLDRGHNQQQYDTNINIDSPPRYLLVGSAGFDYSISLYDLSYFGSDHYLYPQKQPSHQHLSSHLQSQSLSSQTHSISSSEEESTLSLVTHHPIAKSLRQGSTNVSNTATSLPSGHRHPLLGVHWYPADTYGSFVSGSISGEILVWDAQEFVPVFATYTHVYSGSSTWNDNDTAREVSVAPLQCMDLPKTPEGCPHGRALLALGLGGRSGRGVIQLCDVFRGGSATHELKGHGSRGNNGGGDEGVNAIVWDTYHPFRLASGGDDGTVRLWDIRKAGAAACLGVLDCENEYSRSWNGVVEDMKRDEDCYGPLPPFKKQRAKLYDDRVCETQGIRSHSGPVTALAFAAGGEELVSHGLEGHLKRWDLRSNSCHVSTMAAIRSRRSSTNASESSHMDPAVACGGRLVSVYGARVGSNSVIFEASIPPSFRTSSNMMKRHKRMRTSSSLAIIQPGSRNTAIVFSTNIGNKSSQIVAYSLYKKHNFEAQEGRPEMVLNGHLDDVTCLTPVVGAWDNLGVGPSKKNEYNVQLLTAGKDGMVLSWGVPLNHSNIDTEENDNESHDDDGSVCFNTASMLKQHRQHQHNLWNRRYRDGNVSGREWYLRNNHRNQVNNDSSLHDADTW